jgi:cell division protein FtsW
LQSLLSFQKGGLFGNGPGKGVQKLGALPESHTDFLLAAHAEEIGFVGCALIVLLLFVFFQRMLKIALHAPDDFSRRFAYGAAMLIAWQGLVNVAMVSALIPATGLPFPFLSAGGSSLVVFCMMTGIVLNISRQSGGANSRSGSAMMGVA